MPKSKGKTTKNSKNTTTHTSTTHTYEPEYPEIYYPMELTQADLRRYQTLSSKKTNKKQYIQVFTSAYKIGGLTTAAIIIYHIIRNEVSLHKLTYDNKKVNDFRSTHDVYNNKTDIEALRQLKSELMNAPLSNYPTSISLNKFNEYQAFSPITIRKAIAQLEEFKLIKVSVANNFVNQGRVFTLLDNFEYITIPEVENIYRVSMELKQDTSWIKNLAYLVHDKDKARFAKIVKAHKDDVVQEGENEDEGMMEDLFSDMTYEYNPNDVNDVVDF